MFDEELEKLLEVIRGRDVKPEVKVEPEVESNQDKDRKVKVERGGDLGFEAHHCLWCK